MELHSTRLSMRPLTTADLDPVHALWTEPAMRKFLWDDQIITRETVRSGLEQSARDFEARRFGLWGLRPLNNDRDLIGFCGLRLSDVSSHPELLFGLSERAWKRGLATEAARQVLAYAFDQLQIKTIAAVTDVPNEASARVLERIGMKLVRRDQLHGLETLFYEITAVA